MKSLFSRLLLVFVGLLLGGIVSEFAVRRLLPPPQMVEVSQAVPTESYAAVPGEAVVLESRIDQGDRIYRNTPNGKRLRPNMRATIANHHLCQCEVTVSTNSLGYRNPELLQKDRPRVLFLGDSITFAEYIPEPRSWVRQVQHLSEQSSKPFETVNAGVYAIGLANYLSILMETGLSTNPDVVVVGFYLNDVEASPGIKMLKVPAIFQSSYAAQYAFQRISFLKHLLQPYSHDLISSEQMEQWRTEFLSSHEIDQQGDYRNSPEAFNKVISDLFFDWGSAFGESVWQVFVPIFQEFKRLSVKHGFELYFMVFPVELQVGAEHVYDFPQSKLKALGRSLDVPVLDLLPLLRREQRAEPGRPLFYDWCHHTPAGQDLIAREVYNFLTENSNVIKRSKLWKSDE